MPRVLTAIAVAGAQPAVTRREIADAASPGLRLVIQPSGAKSWAFRYERSGGKGVKVTLGPASGSGAMTLAEARQQVSDARRQLSKGIDPADARTADRVAASARRAAEAATRSGENQINTVLDRYVRRHVVDLKSAESVKGYFDREVRPAWGKKLIAEITRKDVIKLIDSIADRGAGTTANRTLANVRAWLNWCVDRGLIQSSPADRVHPPKAEVSRERVLSDVELKHICLALDRLTWPWRQFFTVCLLTAQRRQEIAGMLWAELDLDPPEPTWIISPARTKNGREHAVPLAPQTAAVLRTMPRRADSTFVFTTTGDTSISGFSRAKAGLDQAMSDTKEDEADVFEPWRLHDLRRTAASGMARLGISVAVVEKVLNHTSGTFAGIVGVYQRHDFATEKRHALAAWANHVDSLRAKS